MLATFIRYVKFILSHDNLYEKQVTWQVYDMLVVYINIRLRLIIDTTHVWF